MGTNAVGKTDLIKSIPNDATIISDKKLPQNTEHHSDKINAVLSQSI